MVAGGGGMHGCWLGAVCDCWWGACVVAGRNGVRGCCFGGMHGCWQGGMHGCLGGVIGWRGGCIGYDEIRSMSGRYASYWNAFLFSLCVILFLYLFQFAVDYLARILFVDTLHFKYSTYRFSPSQPNMGSVVYSARNRNQ